MRTAGWCVLIGALALAAGAAVIADAVRRIPMTIDLALVDITTDDDWAEWCEQADAARPAPAVNPPGAPTALDDVCAYRLAPFFAEWDAKVRGRDTTPGPEETP